MLYIVGKIFRKEAWRVYDVESNTFKDFTEESIINVIQSNNEKIIENAIVVQGGLRGLEYNLKDLGFVDKEEKFIVLGRVIENNEIAGFKVVNNKGYLKVINYEQMQELKLLGQIVNAYIRWE